jgi:hypothetical protein
MTTQEMTAHISELMITGMVPQAVATEALAHVASGDMARAYFLLKPYLFEN